MDAFEILGGPNLRGRGRPRLREPTIPLNRPVGRPKLYGDLPLTDRIKLAQKKFQDEKKEKIKKETLRLHELKKIEKVKKEQVKLIGIQKNVQKNRMKNIDILKEKKRQLYTNQVQNLKPEYGNFLIIAHP